MKRKSIILSILLLLIISLPIYGESYLSINVSLDGKMLDFDVKPVIYNDSTYVPFRVIFEELGSKDISWDQEHKRAAASLDGITMVLEIGSDIALVDGKETVLDAPAILENGSILVPVRFVSESFGANVDWDNKNKTIYIDSKENIISIDNESLGLSLSIGDRKQELIEQMGKPDRIDLSELGYDYYIYNKDIKNYIQVGIKDDKIVSFVTNSSNWAIDDMQIGVRKSVIGRNYKINSSGYKNSSKVDLGNNILNLMWDSHNNNSLSSMHLGRRMDIQKLEYNKEVEEGFAKQIHDLTNVYRVRHGLATLNWCEDMTKLATYHCKDMVKNKFFSHNSFNGDSFSTRTSKVLGTPRYAGENIAMGYENALYSIEALYNSLGHRENMLRPEFTCAGVSVIYEDCPYVTHNFEKE